MGVFAVLDTRFSWAVLIVAAICCIFPFFPSFIDPLLVATSVRSIENIQALMLFGLFIFTLLYMKPWDMPNGQKQFWFWAACWWLLLCGRSISWGRDYFPDVPKVYFRGISIILIGSVVFMLFSPHLRQEIARKLKTLSLPVWAMALAIASLVISSSIEHHYAITMFLVHDLQYSNLMEELYEFPLILGLFFTAWAFMQKDHFPMITKVTKAPRNQDEYLESSHSHS